MFSHAYGIVLGGWDEEENDYIHYLLLAIRCGIVCVTTGHTEDADANTVARAGGQSGSNAC